MKKTLLASSLALAFGLAGTAFANDVDQDTRRGDNTSTATSTSTSNSTRTSTRTDSSTNRDSGDAQANAARSAALNNGSTGSFSIPHGPDGSLWIGVMNSTYQKAIDSAVCGKAPTGNGLLNDLPLPWSGKSSSPS